MKRTARDMHAHSADGWCRPPAPAGLADDVHVWRASLAVTPARVEEFAGTLAPDERARAARFRFPRDRERAIVARGLLRAIIGRYLGREPGALAFRYNAFGKPALADALDGEGIAFNVSHAGDIALYALTRRRAVGVDVECVRADMETDGIAERFFSPPEVAALRALDPALRREAFFACWTRKEAYVKAVGEGIGVGLDRFAVSLAPGEPAAVLAVRGAGHAPWFLHHLAPAPGYVGAVAVRGGPCRVSHWRWEEPA